MRQQGIPAVVMLSCWRSTLIDDSARDMTTSPADWFPLRRPQPEDYNPSMTARPVVSFVAEGSVTARAERMDTPGSGSTSLSPASGAELLRRDLGRTDYLPTWRAMQAFTETRGPDTADELWLTEHLPVYTLGLAGRREHLHVRASGLPIDIVQTDRGGQVTYHGPGQVVMYTLIDLHRRGLTVRPLVRLLEQAVIDCLGQFSVVAHGRVDAPGVYVGAAKIAALGLKVRRGATYHGVALNVDMDLAPFADIDPCGYPGLVVTQTRDHGIGDSPAQMADRLARQFSALLSSRFPILER
jgi:lipoyl(octanoyl) transferase